MEILVRILCPIITYNQAKSKGLSTGRAIAGGLFFNIFSIIYYWMQEKTIDKKAQEQIELMETIKRKKK